ncbi:MAG: formate dehydrogenase accessory protein FdhE [Amaricoccus sp.]|uniref:formate dehydrogenase accessory protein FdhE domain-containing protein n=1 Tax=Amaricoccus sp. TaxID=1872485 RepID=UPI0039E43FBE
MSDDESAVRPGVIPEPPFVISPDPVALFERRAARLRFLAEGARYAACATCCTLWNEVRIKCLACGSTKGIGYRALGDAAVIKAEVCDECHGWTKILYATRDTALEPIADDVASLGLDAAMAGSDWRRAGFNPFLIGF